MILFILIFGGWCDVYYHGRIAFFPIDKSTDISESDENAKCSETLPK